MMGFVKKALLYIVNCKKIWYISNCDFMFLRGAMVKIEYTDIHCHMLPGVDDGSDSMDTTISMLGIAYEEGCTKIVLTPHYEAGANKYEPKQLDKIYDEVKKEAKDRYPGLELYLGNELLYEPGVVSHVKDGLVHTMGGTKYILVEFNIRISYKELYNALKELVQGRFRPIVAHVERYQCLTGNMDRIYEICDLGVLLQMNAESIFGSIFDERVRWCRKLMKERYISFLGTDAHDLVYRAPHMKEALEWMYKKYGENYVRAISQEYPDKMLANEYIED